MAVYVDILRTYSSDYSGEQSDMASRVGSRNNHQWCHLWADSEDELHDFAKSIGLKREWFQNKDILPHYDLTPGRRKMALKKGAVEADVRDAVEKKLKELDT